MLYKLVVPGSSEDVGELHLLQWHAAVGEAIAEDALLVELETHKVVIEIRAERAAFLRRVGCETDGWHRPGEVLAVLSDMQDEPLPEDADALPDFTAAFEIV